MPEDFGDDIPAGPSTLRGREWPCLRQFCVFLENRVGCLHELLKLLEESELRVMALSVVDTVDFAVVRLIVDEADRARELFTLHGFTMTENDLLGVEMPDDPQPFVSVFVPLVSAEINISYAYPLLYGPRGRGALAIHVDNIDQSAQILRDQGHRLLTENDLQDEFF